MAYRIAFWNINAGEGSWKDRLSTLTAWCGDMKPDLLFLEEVSYTLEKSLESITGMKKVAHAVVLDKNNQRSTKDLWALQKDGNGFKGAVARISGMMSRRPCVKAWNNNLTIWGLHANSSYKGGCSAVIATDLMIQGAPENVVGGDFNFDILRIPKLKEQNVLSCQYSRPLSWQKDTYLKFTQWNKEFGSPIDEEEYDDYHLKKYDVGYYKIEAHNVIDYAVYSNKKRTVVSEANCIDEQQWAKVLKNFDHCPVVYSVK